MIDIKFLRENPDVVKENIKKKFQDQKIELVDKEKEHCQTANQNSTPAQTGDTAQQIAEHNPERKLSVSLLKGQAVDKHKNQQVDGDIISAGMIKQYVAVRRS